MDSASVREEAMGVLFEPGKRMARIDPEILEPADLGRVLSFYQRLNHIGLRISPSPELNIVFAMTQAISVGVPGPSYFAGLTSSEIETKIQATVTEASKWASVVEQYFFNNPDGTFHRDLILAVLNNNKVSAAAREDPQSHLWGITKFVDIFKSRSGGWSPYIFDNDGGSSDYSPVAFLPPANQIASVGETNLPNVLDSGNATGHLISDNSYFVSYEKYSSPKTISSYGGSDIVLEGEGKIAVVLKGDGGTNICHIADALYFPAGSSNLFSDSVWRTHDVSFHTVPSGDCLAYFGEEKVGRVGGARDAKSHICANIVPVKFTRNIVPPTGSFKFSGNSIDWDQICRQGPEAMRKVDKSAFAVGKGLPVLSQSLKFIAKEAVLNSQALDCVEL
ncbi:uncharacterized protein SAPINGB_P002461 [Magnusiomyces paraingens]|uniref:Retrovirus-related Pol polyprotein from transposon TNT 1-94-like beta-barrel domain-containing protein n=1 Tax=Magnusiomyces paraingens TaxID=2606893 RepID=A0A5E8BE25_9ASCO|nr:uncharacterized protein SAPINGB_P002461 [Saprochaete ingens]VVT49823.1 unnamed protein product [Saprochaete ingens]